MDQDLRLSYAEAKAKMAQIDDMSEITMVKLHRMNDDQQAMLGSTWAGGSASIYGAVSTEQHGEFTGIINQLNELIVLGNSHTGTISATDTPY
jgi:hypothetical protein